MKMKSGGPVGPTNWKMPEASMPEHIQAKDIQPHKIVTQPNGVGRMAGSPRGHRELPKPIIPTPVQKSFKKS